MKNAIIILILSVSALAAYSKTAECTFNDGTVLRASINESPMIADLTQISIQRPGQDVQNFLDNVQGAIYTDISGSPEDSVVLNIWENADPDNKPLFSVTSAEEGNAKSGSVVTDYSTNTKQSVVCKEVE